MRTLLMTAVYRKALLVKRAKNDTMGRIINLYASDSQLIFQGIQLLTPGIVSPFIIAGPFRFGVFERRVYHNYKSPNFAHFY